MKRYFILLAIVCVAFAGKSQGQKHWVFFEDKGPEETWHAAHPEQLLSPRAVERRNKMGLPIDRRDIPVSSTYLSQLSEAGVTVVKSSKWLNAASIESDLSFHELRAICPQIADMRPVGTYTRHATEIPTEPIVGDEEEEATAGMFTYGQSEDQVFQIGAECLHDKGFTGTGVLIAVFDAGFMNMDTFAAFDSLFINGQILTTWDFVDGNPSVYEDNWHGMSVASTIGGNLPGQFVGTAPHATFALARTEDVSQEVHQEEDNWLLAVEWADSLGADMIQSSLGYSEFDPGQGDYTYQDLDGDQTIITRAADIAADKGILVVSSAGNAGNSAWRYITAPCDADSILCVGAVDGMGDIAGFSSVGPTVDGRVKPDIMAWGAGSAIVGFGGNVSFGSGTSFSAPIACGMVACLIQAHPLRNNMEVIEAVRQSSDRYMVPDSGYGYGIPNACMADSILDVMDSLALNAEIFSHPDRFFKFYPNPVTDELFIEQIGLGLQPSSVQVYTAEGKMVLQQDHTDFQQGRFSVNVKALPKGMYLLKLGYFGNQTISHKFIRQ